MATNKQRQSIDSKRAMAFFNSRGLVKVAHVGKRFKFFVSTNGNIIDVTDKEGNMVREINNADVVLRKKIFNIKANSEAAVLAAPNAQLRRDALAAEKAGDAEKASELFNQFLNKVQFSFSVLSTSKLFDTLTGGMEITAEVQEVVTDNGKLLTLDPSSITIVETESIGKNSNTMLWTGDEPEEEEETEDEEEAEDEEEEEEDETPEETAARLKAEAKAAKAAKKAGATVKAGA